MTKLSSITKTPVQAYMQNWEYEKKLTDLELIINEARNIEKMAKRNRSVLMQYGHTVTDHELAEKAEYVKDAAKDLQYLSDRNRSKS